MKKLAAASAIVLGLNGSAFAADAVVDEVVFVDSAYNWSGVYVGGLVGYGWGDSRFDDSAPSNTFDIDGAFGGLTVGYNYQFAARWVAGVEADVAFSGIDGIAPGNLGIPDGGGDWMCGTPGCSTEVTWFGTARARLGYALDNLLVYGTGGLAFGRIESEVVGDPDFFIEETNVGWAAGAGVEYAFTQNWTAKLEYMHVDLGWTDRNPPPGNLKSETDFDAVRFGVNYKF